MKLIQIPYYDFPIHWEDVCTSKFATEHYLANANFSRQGIDDNTPILSFDYRYKFNLVKYRLHLLKIFPVNVNVAREAVAQHGLKIEDYYVITVSPWKPSFGWRFTPLPFTTVYNVNKHITSGEKRTIWSFT